MFKRLTLALLSSILLPSGPVLAAELQPEVQAGMIVGPVLHGFAGGEVSAGLKGHPWKLTLQAFSPRIGPAMDLNLVGWMSATPLTPDETLTWGPIFGLMRSFILNPAVTGGMVWPRPILGFTIQRAWGQTWLKLSPNVMLEAFGAPNVGTPFVTSSLGVGPPLLEVGYQISPNVGVSLRTSMYAPLKISFQF